MRKLFKRLHLWLALPFGLIIMTTCLTGAVLVFEKELTQLVYHDRYTVSPRGAQPLPIPQLIDRVATTLPDSVTITGVTIPSDPERPYIVGLSKPRRAGVLIDPYTAEIKGRSDRSPFFMTVFRLHRWLLDSMTPGREGIFWGRVIVGTSTLLFVVILLTGLVLWWPRRLRGIGKRLRISLRHGTHRLMHDLHAVGGVYASLLLLVMALTGLTWSFEWYRTGFYRVFGVQIEQGGHGAPARGTRGEGRGERGSKARGEQARGGRPEGRRSRGEGAEQATKPKAPATYLHWDRVYREVSAQSTTYREISISEEEARGSLSSLGNVFAADTYRFDPDTGQITEVKLYRDAKREQTIRGWIYSVHIGAWGGLTTRILAFLAALFGASLPLTGYYLFVKRKLGRRGKTGRKAKPSPAVAG